MIFLLSLAFTVCVGVIHGLLQELAMLRHRDEARSDREYLSVLAAIDREVALTNEVVRATTEAYTELLALCDRAGASLRVQALEIIEKAAQRPARLGGTSPAGDTTLEIFNVPAEEQLALTHTLHSARLAAEMKIGPIVFIFHTPEAGRILYAGYLAGRQPKARA